MNQSTKTMKQCNNEIMKRGVSIYLATMIMFILLAIGLGISLIIVSQMKMIRGMSDSVIALYAADTGIERALYEPEPFSIGNVGGASYIFKVVCCVPGEGNCLLKPNECDVHGLTEDSDCNALYLCYTSVGTYKGIKRAIETTR